MAKHHCLHAHTESIRLRGYLDKRYSLLALKHSLPHTLSKFVCGKLTASCVHLRDIEFNFIDVSSIAITDLPSRLERLALIRLALLFNNVINENTNFIVVNGVYIYLVAKSLSTGSTSVICQV